jgi:ubiquinone/menaquinone biosynthesis C-methylase UbiE
MPKKPKLTTKNWFNRWSNEYDRTLGSISFHRKLLDLVVKNSGLKAGQKILDIGCGTGLLSLKLLQAKNCRVTGVDYSDAMLNIFKDKIQRLKLAGRVTVQRMDAGELNFKDNSFDRAVSTVTLHHLKAKLPAVKRIFRILKPGGIFLIGEIDMDSTGKLTDTKRLKRILAVLEQEWVPALRDAGVEAFAKMFENGKKHIITDGEYCVGLRQWADICRQAGFGPVTVKRVPGHKCFGVVIARKYLKSHKVTESQGHQ